MGQDRNARVNATVRRWQLTEHLRRLREASGLTIEQAGAELQKRTGRWSRSKVWRIETRQQNVKPAELKQLLDVYGITDEALRAELRDLAEKANERGWWLAYGRGFPEAIHPFVELESAMLSLRTFETMFVPGLLQTSDYARALVNGISPHFTPDQVERRVAGRMARQQVLAREDPPEIHAIVEEGILERPVGLPRVMRAQLRRLIETAESPNITIQLLPKSAGANPGMDGPFSILSLPEPVPDFGSTEGAAGTVYVENREHVRDLVMKFGTLTQLALSASDSLGKIAAAAQRYDQ